MSIAIITPGAFPVPPIKGGSVEIVVNGLGHELAKHIRTIIFSKKVNELPSFQQQGNRIDIRIPFHSKEQYLTEIENYIASEELNCLQIENRPLYIPFLKKKFPQLKMILSLHSLTFIKSISKEAAFKALSEADVIFVNSQFIKEEILRLFPQLETTIMVQYLGIDEHTFVDRFSIRGKSLRRKWRNKYHLHGKQVLLFVGRLIKEKGLHLLLKSLPALIKKHPNIHLLIVGSSHYGRQVNTPYIQKIKRLTRPIAKYVTFTNFIPPKIIPQIYHVADLVVTPSLGKEAFCLVNLEAALSGIPVISTNVGGIPEVVSHEISGYLISPSKWDRNFRQYATLLLQSKEMNENMGKSGQTLANQKFTWKKTIEHYISSYEQLLALKLKEMKSAGGEQ